MCLPCRKALREATRPIGNMTKGQFFSHRKSWISAAVAIRQHARTVFAASDKKKSCVACDYKLHFDVCHIKSVASFSDDASVALEINAIENLVALCPNHHWEFDNGIFDLSRDTISLVDGMTHYHSAAGSNPAPASNVEGQGTFAITPNPGAARPDQFSRQAL